ncbi:MAG: methyltransferase type 11 [Candidatus Magasanikbacteria bacterium CG10_big_fil_rev_8_21_14_0_10_43_6]|uniref:Methyltransferase type 11 n=1 Tax=Candidatus Magasanikbacteria bacterium CG10_big_fil_rev_8_21_14_0_10_43_6 TaxID=1974650 RepID=A0A2M6W0D0_9BACT|nr:MAG: methyltransferase type 11 [Candidatus Magasanikbacteria bacterium CG10_big_fil_rev_8_21_14_0_10_43_6]
MSSTYTKQVGREHYGRGSYRSQDRWNSYWHQLDLVRSCSPQSVLEVGIGEGVVARELRTAGIKTITLDIAEDLNPDVLGSVTDIPLDTASVDLVLAAEIIEHIRFEDVPHALSEIARVCRNDAIISIPHPGYIFELSFKIPLLPRITLFTKMPFFWKTHQFDGQHYWELGKQKYSFMQFLQTAREAGLVIKGHYCYADDPARRYFLFATRNHD